MIDWKNSRLPFLVELPALAIQITAISALLVFTYSDLVLTLFGTILSIIWLNISRHDIGDELGKLRAYRTLFGKLGEWLGRNDAYDEFDAAFSRHMYIDQGIQHEHYSGLVLGQGMANFIRGIVSALVYVYLIFVIVQVIVGQHSTPT